jgi:thioredoxin reductase/NAD-dependent dihydropyrimidine dehydrogenase PreA subunit
MAQKPRASARRCRNAPTFKWLSTLKFSRGRRRRADPGAGADCLQCANRLTQSRLGDRPSRDILAPRFRPQASPDLPAATPMLWLPYVALALVVMGVYLALRARSERQHADAQRESIEQGLHEPASLHPVVDPKRCIGSGGCVHACPEQALGIVGGKAVLVNGAACIGHGACQVACPVEAIKLVFGSEKRGVDIPSVSPEFESNVPGIYIAGELGGMGLIRKAAEQGQQAIDALRKRRSGPAPLDVLIVGAGPAGMSAGLSAIHHKLKYRLIEQEESLGGAVYHYPRQKIAMTAPVTLALVGKVKVGEIQKEELLALWNGIMRRTGLQVSFKERLESIDRDGDTFHVKTNLGRYHTRSVLLAIGRRGSPRKLGVPGEDTRKVTYRLIDPEQYRGRAVLVVGGGDSALEAAVSLAEQPDTRVTLSYRSDAFSRVKEKNRQALETMRRQGRLEVLLSSSVTRIEPKSVLLDTPGGQRSVANDEVIVCAGGELPTALLQRAGIRFETKYGTA